MFQAGSRGENSYHEGQYNQLCVSAASIMRDAESTTRKLNGKSAVRIQDVARLGISQR